MTESLHRLGRQESGKSTPKDAPAPAPKKPEPQHLELVRPTNPWSYQ
jgi:hypothetical protein